MDDMKGFTENGFLLLPLGEPYGFIKAVRGNSEVHLMRKTSTEYSMRIPITRLSPGRTLPPRLSKYMDERNRNHKGPGRLVYDSRFIWYTVDEVPKEEMVETAVRMQEVVERLGPKILNQMS